MGCAKMKKLLCHGLAVAMVVSLTATASDSSAAAKKAKPAKKTIKIEQGKSKKIVVKNKKKKATNLPHQTKELKFQLPARSKQ